MDILEEKGAEQAPKKEAAGPNLDKNDIASVKLRRTPISISQH
jgi:hypothetical protein